MVFDGQGPLVKRWNGFNGSNRSSILAQTPTSPDITCPGRKSTSDVCDLARRPLSSNIFSLHKESEKVNEGGTVKEGEEENEGANGDKEVVLKVGSQQLIKCCLASFLADQV